MNADEIIAAIKKAVGDPHGGAVAEALPLIEEAVRQTVDGPQETKTAAKPRTETRVIEAEETRDA